MRESSSHQNTGAFVVYQLDNIWWWLSVVDFRVFSDRLVDHSDMEAFVALLGEKLGTLFDLTFHSICHNKQPPIFGTFITGRSHAHTLLCHCHTNECKNTLTSQILNWYYETVRLMTEKIQMCLCLFLCVRVCVRWFPKWVSCVWGPTGHEGSQEVHGDSAGGLQPDTWCSANESGALPRCHWTQCVWEHNTHI